MNSTDLYQEIRDRMAPLNWLDHLVHLSLINNNEGEFQKNEALLEVKRDEIRKWMLSILSSRAEEICRLIRIKEWPSGVTNMPGKKAEPSCLEVIAALGLIPDRELEKFLPPDCMDMYRSVR